MRAATPCLIVLVLACSRAPEQRANPTFVATVEDPSFADPQHAPTICIDEGHANFHTLEGRYAPFGQVLRADGYDVQPSASTFTSESLGQCDVLVIANALHESNIESWALPNPSAFSTDEITAVHTWVESGGALWLIADHMPFAGAAQELAAAFGFEFANGFALRSGESPPDLFTRDNGGLAAHPITDGQTPDTRVEQVATFTGQGFRAPAEAQPILTLGQGYASLEPEIAWQFNPDTPRRDISGWIQGATLQLGEGRVAMFGEAAMFTSQLIDDGPPVGLDHPAAIGNTILLRNVARWLNG